MPKTVWTPRDELVCGKLDRAYEIAIRFESIELLDLLADIRHDCERMEQKLISRKEQVKAMYEQINIARREQNEYKKLDALPNKREAFIADNQREE